MGEVGDDSSPAVGEGEKITVHFAKLMNICHHNNTELESKCQKYKGQVVLRGDIVKDDSGSRAVFTEQGSSASQMTICISNDGRKSNGNHCKTTKLCRTSSRRRISLHSSTNERRSKIAENSQIGMSRLLDVSTTT